MTYADGKVVSEPDCDWSAAPQEGRVSLRLHCPNGEKIELGNTQDATGKLFQFKIGELKAGVNRSTVAHVVGLVDSADGGCRYAAWDYALGRLVTGRDNVYAMNYQQVGRLSFEPLGLRASNW
jgi:hypothetical protein